MCASGDCPRANTEVCGDRLRSCLKGLSPRNLKYALAFYQLFGYRQQVAADNEISDLVKVPWEHHILIIGKSGDLRGQALHVGWFVGPKQGCFHYENSLVSGRKWPRFVFMRSLGYCARVRVRGAQCRFQMRGQAPQLLVADCLASRAILPGNVL